MAQLLQDFHPTVRPRAPFDPAADANTLKKAMKGLGTDEAAIIKVLACRPSIQRQAILQYYNSSFERDLIKDLKKELSGNFEDVILAMMTPLHDYLAKELHDAIKKKNGTVIVEILCAYDNNLIRAISASYNQQFDDSLKEDLDDDLSGVFEKLMVEMSKGDRKDDYSDEVNEKVAKQLYNKGQGLAESEMIYALSTYSFKQLKGIFIAYYAIAGRTLGETFDHEYKLKEKANMKATFECLEKRVAFFAAALRNSMKGVGTKDKDLIRLMITRAEFDLASIKSEYQTIYDKSLEADIKGETAGDYKKMLLALVNPNFYG